MTFTFTSRTGGDPSEYWLAIHTAANVQINDALKGGRYLRDEILALTSRGVDYNRSPFAQYSAAYARRTGKSTVDLRLTGRMLGALRFSVNGTVYDTSARGTSKEPAYTMGIGIYDDPNDAIKAQILNEGLTRQSVSHRGRPYTVKMPKRRWLDANRATVRGVNQIMFDSIHDRVEKEVNGR